MKEGWKLGEAREEDNTRENEKDEEDSQDIEEVVKY